MVFLTAVNVINNLFCMTLLLLIVSVFPKRNHSVETEGLKSVYLMTSVFLACEALWAIVNSFEIPELVPLNKVINVFDFVSEASLSFLWMKYYEMRFVKGKAKTYADKWYAYVPITVLAVLCIVSCSTGWMFVIDAGNHYSKGPFYFIQLDLIHAYPLLTVGQGITMMKKAKTKTERRTYFILAFYIFFPLFFGFLQILFPKLLLTGCGVTMALINVFIRIQDQEITKDGLTNCNNRYSLDRYLIERTHDYDGGKRGDSSLFVIMMDLNNFKGINDKYGHTEGDKALCLVAKALIKICEVKGMFLARYGGDEFTVVCETDEGRISEICNSLRDTVALIDTHAEYALSASVGFAKYEGEEMNIDDWVGIADEMLYSEKRMLTGD